MKLFLTLASLGLFASLASAKVDYSGYKVFKTKVDSEATAGFLKQLEDQNVFNFWNSIRMGQTTDIMTSPKTAKTLERFLSSHRIEFETMIEDVEALAIASPMSPTGPAKDPKQGHNMDWTSYHDLADIYGYFDYLEANYDYVSTEIIGQSYEGQDVRVLKVCQGGCGSKPAMYLDSGIHAREWIGPAANTYMLDQLTQSFDAAADQDLLDNLDWYFIASVNPDGYRYTIEEDRMWRKTRKPNEGSVCIGTDANRNYDWHFGGIGSSDSPCSDSYHGTEAWSEVEAANIRDFVLSVADNVVFSDSIHSYSQLILLPWGCESTLPDNYDEQMRVGNLANQALFDVHGKVYEIGNTWDTIYPASGLTVDWAFGAAGIPYSYSMELRDKGLYGFLLPEDQIIPTGEEVWAFHAVVAREMIKLYKK